MFQDITVQRYFCLLLQLIKGCNWDGDDCDGVEPVGGETDHRPAFYQAIDFVNVLYERTLVKGMVIIHCVEMITDEGLFLTFALYSCAHD